MLESLAASIVSLVSLLASFWISLVPCWASTLPDLMSSAVFCALRWSSWPCFCSLLDSSCEMPLSVPQAAMPTAAAMTRPTREVRMIMGREGLSVLEGGSCSGPDSPSCTAAHSSPGGMNFFVRNRGQDLVCDVVRRVRLGEGERGL